MQLGISLKRYLGLDYFESDEWLAVYCYWNGKPLILTNGKYERLEVEKRAICSGIAMYAYNRIPPEGEVLLITHRDILLNESETERLAQIIYTIYKRRMAEYENERKEIKMNDLINIDYNNSDRPTVLGRDLHEALEVETRYNDWFKRMCEYGFNEGEDFYSILSKNPEGGRPSTDHQLTISMAKELCMIQRTERGKQCRQYFIQVEEAWNKPESVMSRALQFANRQLDSIKADNERLALQLKNNEPFVLFAKAVETSQSSILIGDLAKLIKQNGVDIGQKRLFVWLRDNGYLIKSGSSTNMPTQKSMDMKLFEVKERSISNPDGTVRVTRTTKVTGKGQTYFINLFLKGA